MILKAFVFAAIVAAGSSNKQEVEKSKPHQENPFTESEEVFCTMDVQVCPDGSHVARDPENDCQFGNCPNGNEPKSKD